MQYIALLYVDVRTDEICLEAVRQDGCALKFVEEQTERLCLEAIKTTRSNIVTETMGGIFTERSQDEFPLQFIKKQTLEMRLGSVMRNGCALKCVIDQTEQICMEAVKQNGRALQFVKNQTKEMCLEAVKQCGGTLRFVKIQTEEICMEAVKKDMVSMNDVTSEFKNKLFKFMYRK